MIILEENFQWHLEAFASELFICQKLLLFSVIVNTLCKKLFRNMCIILRFLNACEAVFLVFFLLINLAFSYSLH